MIFFFINSQAGLNTGMGGHYYSLLHTVTEMERLGEACTIVVLGDMRPKAFTGREYAFYPKTAEGLAQFKVDFAALLPQARVFHTFDKSAGKIIELALREYSAPLIVTKPGRPPESWKRRRYRNMVFFQESEFLHEQALARLSGGLYNPALIPNRISPTLIRGTGRRSPFTTKPGLKLLRIGRINPGYNKVVRQSVNLMERLRALGHKVELAVVGTVESQNALDKLQAQGWPDVVFRTSDDFTVNAAQLIEFADIVVGIGRGAMEAMVHRKPTFVSCTDPALPVFLDAQTFPEAFAHNFSQRTPAIGPCAPEAALARFQPLLESEPARQAYRGFQDDVALRYLDASAGAKALLAYYQTCKKDPWYGLTFRRIVQVVDKTRTLLAR